MRKILPVLLLLLCLEPLFAQTVFKDYVDGQLYVKFTGASLKALLKEDPLGIPSDKIKELSSCFAAYGVTHVSRPFYQASDDANLSSILKVQFTHIAQANAFIDALAKTGAVAYAEKIPVLKTEAVPNDPVFPAQLTQINAVNAWNVFNGNSNITVAIVDDAIMWTHADLSANIYTNPGEIPNNNIDDDSNGYVDDVHGWDASDLDNNTVPSNTAMTHGTHCAGIAGACTNNGIGIAAIGWNIKIIPVKCQNDNGSLTGISNGYEGIIYAARAKARVISCSWGGSNTITGQSVIDYAWARGCLVIAAAGNNSTSTPQYPAAFNNVYCVGSVDNSDIKSSFSNYGSWVDICAPGNNINSTVPYTGATPAYLSMSGTSMATPLVAGLAGLMLSECSYMTATDVMHCINSTAVNIYTLSGNGSYFGQMGAGRIEAYQAMTCAAGVLSYPPLANFFARPAISCTNTPVQFTDSSLYQPASWQWTFQGGSPATSTLANPAVQWSAPGLYPVSLTVSNANGSNSITKLSYINIAAPSALPFSEGFQAGAFLPPGWSAINVGNDDSQWQRQTGLGGFGTSTACILFDNYTYNVAGDRDEIRTPHFDFNNVAQAKLRFDVAYAPYDNINSDTLEVKVSTDCGISWTTIYLKGGNTLATGANTSNFFTPSPGQWRRDSIDISSITAGQGSVLFSFINHGQYGQPIYLDNINLAFPSPTVAMQVPSSACASVSLSYSNQSNGAGAYIWTMAGATPSTSSLNSPTVSYASAGNYTVLLLGANGTATDTISQAITVNPYPTASLTVSDASCSSCSDGSIQATTLTGNAPFSYSWAPSGGTAATAAGLSPGCYTVTIDGSGCASTETACVSFITTTVTGIAKIPGFETLNIYPNPAQDQLTVELAQPFRYRLFSSIGQMEMQSELNVTIQRIPVRTLAKGMYLLEIESGMVVVRRKILVE